MLGALLSLASAAVIFCIYLLLRSSLCLCCYVERRPARSIRSRYSARFSKVRAVPTSIRIWSNASRSPTDLHSIVIVSFVFPPSSLKMSVATGSGRDGIIRTANTSRSGAVISLYVPVKECSIPWALLTHRKAPFGRRSISQTESGTPLRIAPAPNEARALKHIEVLGDRRLAQGERLHELRHVRVSRRETSEDRASCGIGERSEGQAQTIGLSIYLHIAILPNGDIQVKPKVHQIREQLPTSNPTLL